jgi:hypothetical protein
MVGSFELPGPLGKGAEKKLKSSDDDVLCSMACNTKSEK